MAERVRAAVLVEPSKIEIQEFDVPDIGREDGLLKVELCGVCGSDPKIFPGELALCRNYPFIMGHEIVGRIAKIGDIASQRWEVREGDRVVLEPKGRCGYCSSCIAGDYRYCKSVISYGTRTSTTVKPSLWGGYAEYVYLPAGALVHKISEKVPAEAAVLVTAVVADAIRWGRKVGDFGIGDAVVVQGVGQQGLCQVVVAKESGCSPIIATGLSRDAERLALAKEFGADYVVEADKQDVAEFVREVTGGALADIVVDVTGSAKTIQVSLGLVRSQGTLVLPSVTGGKAVPIVTDEFVLREIKMVGVWSADYPAIRKAIKLVESGKYPLEKIVSHIFPLEATARAIKTAGGTEDVYPVKVAVRP